MKKKSTLPCQVKRILICDNESRTRQALRALLLTREIACEEDTDLRIQVVGEARDGREAVQSVEVHLPEVVIMDAHMPVMNGIDASAIIKDRWPQVKVIMLTMFPDQRQAALDAGVDTFLIKGCQAETLFEAILSE